METGKLELKDICGYLPYDLKVAVYRGETSLIGNCYGSINHYLRATDDFDNDEIYREESEDMKPILHPLSDLYKTITHNGKEIVPIVELAKMTFPNNRNHTWVYNEKSKQAFSNYYGNFYFEDCSFHIEDGGNVFNQTQLFDYLHELKIDYRGLIDAGLAIDVNTLNVNPYK